MGGKLYGLDFSTPHNAALSLRVIAEYIRRGDLPNCKIEAGGGGATLIITVSDPNHRRAT
ncbi:MAG: hypothetical protein GC190_19215 [Alphaproteobacteria bacterium]|nr:hypothetical protein [Alphaproteobacteria bacterium]